MATLGHPRTLKREQRVLTQITRNANDHWRHLSDAASAEGRRRCADAGLTAEQTEAALGLATRWLGVLTADAPGAGKTATMKGLRLLAPEGQAIVGLAVSTAAARRLGDAASLPAANIAAALTAAANIATARNADERARRHAESQASLPNGGCWIIDEASMVSTSRLEQLLALGTERGAQIILAGDPAQLDPISGGAGIFGAAVARVDIPTERLRTIRRPRDRWEADAWARLADGDASALSDFAAHGRFLGAGDADEGDNAINQIVAMWMAASSDHAPSISDDTPEGVRRLLERRTAKLDDDLRQLATADQAAKEAGDDKIRKRAQRRIGTPGRLDPLAIAYTNADVDRINAAIRNAANPRPDAAAAPKRDRPRKLGRHNIQLDWTDDHGAEHTWEFRVGDIVMTTRNDNTIKTDKNNTIANTQRWHVAGIFGDAIRLASLEGHGHVYLPERYWRSVDAKTGRPPLQLGYAATLYKAQGASVDVSFCLDSHHINRPGLLVGLTRSRWGSWLIGAGSDTDVAASAHQAHRRPGNQTAAIDAHRLGREAGGLTPEEAAILDTGKGLHI